MRRALGTLRGPDRRARRRRRLGRDVHGIRAGGGRVPPRRTRRASGTAASSSAPRSPCASPGWWGPGPAPACDRARTGHFASPPFPPRSPRSSAAPPRTLGGSWRSAARGADPRAGNQKRHPRDGRRALASGAGVNVEVTDTVFRACSAGGAGGGVAALDGAAVALADSAALDCAGGADGTGNEVRGGGVERRRRHRSRRCATSLPSGVRSPRRTARAGRERGRRRVVDGGRSARRRLCELLRRRRVRGHGVRARDRQRRRARQRGDVRRRYRRRRALRGDLARILRVRERRGGVGRRRCSRTRSPR